MTDGTFRSRGYFREDECVRLTFTNGRRPPLRYDSVEALQAALDSGDLTRSVYDGATSMVIHERSKQMPSAWPARLQVLSVSFSLAPPEKFPPLPPSMRSVTYAKCPMLTRVDVPAMCDACRDLEEVILYGSGVRTVHPRHDDVMGPSSTSPQTFVGGSALRVLDIDFCHVAYLDLRCLPTSLAVLNASDNVSDTSRMINVVGDRNNLMGGNANRGDGADAAEQQGRQFLNDGRGHGNDEVRNGAGPAGVGDGRLLWSSAHNVHARAIQKSACASMTALNTAFEAALLQLRERRKPREMKRDGDGEEEEPPKLKKKKDEEEDEEDTMWFRECVVALTRACQKNPIKYRMFLPSLYDTAITSVTSFWNRSSPREDIDSNSDSDDCPPRISGCGILSSMNRKFGNKTTRPMRHDDITVSPSPKLMKIMRDQYSGDTMVHSLHAITIGEMLRRVWTVVSVNPCRDVLTDVLMDEIADGHQWCFTGRFTRLMNVLCGFVEGIHIGIDPKDELRSRLAVLWSKIDSLKDDDDEGGEALVKQACVYVVDAGVTEWWGEAYTWIDPFGQSLLTGKNHDPRGKEEALFREAVVEAAEAAEARRNDKQ